MTGKFYIDGRDAYSAFGVFVTEGGYNELLAFAPLKSVVSNAWQEEDGEEFDLSAPVLDTRELSINFAAHGFGDGFGVFVELLSSTAYHQFEFKQLGRSYTLRLVSQPNLTLARQLRLLTLRFADDFPPKGGTPKTPQSGLAPQGYGLDERSLAEYGVIVLDGCDAEIEQSPAVKKNLLRNIGSLGGAIYAGEVVTFEAKDVKINCLMRADTLAEFWCNYDALLVDLVQPGERSLYVEKTGAMYPCYYKNCSVSRFYPMGKIWFEFTIILVFTSFRARGDEYILCSESGEWVVSEDGNHTIDLRTIKNE